MAGRRPLLMELPGGGVIVQGRLDADRGRAVRRQVEREIAKRQRQAKAAGLDVGLLQRPVVEEQALLFLFGQRLQVRHLRRCEEPRRHILGQPPADMFHIHPHLAAYCHRAGDQPVGVGDVEAQVRDAGGSVENLGPAMRVGDELPVGRRHLCVARQHGAHQCASEQKAVTVALEDQPRHAFVFLGGEQRQVPRAPGEGLGAVGQHQIHVHRAERQQLDHADACRRRRSSNRKMPDANATAARLMPSSAPYSFMKSSACSPYITAR